MPSFPSPSWKPAPEYINLQYKYVLKKWVLSSTSLFLNGHPVLKPLYSAIYPVLWMLIKTGLGSGSHDQLSGSVVAHSPAEPAGSLSGSVTSECRWGRALLPLCEDELKTTGKCLIKQGQCPYYRWSALRRKLKTYMRSLLILMIMTMTMDDDKG